MNVSQVIPPSDLLRQVEGVEQGLRKRRRIGLLGWFGLLVTAAAQLSVLLANSAWLDALVNLKWDEIAERWPLLLLLFAFGLSFVTVVWKRFWLKESTEPFRYTFSIAEFTLVGGNKPQPRFALLRTDLAERLSDRIPRLSHLAEEFVKEPEGSVEEGTRRRSHIHVSGYYARRERPGDQWLMEVTPWVRIGAPGKPETLANPVKFNVPKPQLGKPDPVGPTEYDQILERVYSSVATEIYAQIALDVQEKIELLPSKYFRAVAFFHEAEDYARSNTLDAYSEARKLYERMLQLYEPSWQKLSRSPLRRRFHRAGRAFARWRQWMRVAAARVWPRLGRLELMLARAHVGYAKMLIYSRALAGISGRRVDPVFEARPVAEEAVRRLKRISEMPGGRIALFDATVALGLAWHGLGAADKAERNMEAARSLIPSRADSDPVFLYLRAKLESELLPSLQRFRQAVEQAPKFQAAQFELARASENLWRTRGTLEASTADSVLAEYDRVVEMNPGIVGAWANIGYIRWLGRMDEARQRFERGLDYKEIKRETFLSEVDYGLARLTAEEGDFKAAYDHYVRAISSLLGEGVSHAPGGVTSYYFELIGDAMLRRFHEYRRKVVDELRCRRDEIEPGCRVRDSVYAFVLNDHAEALWHAYLRSGDPRHLKKARLALCKAIRRNPNFLVPHHNLYRIYNLEGDTARASEQLEAVRKLDPSWPDAMLDIAILHATKAKSIPQDADDLRRQAHDLDQEAAALRDRDDREADKKKLAADERLKDATKLEESRPKRLAESLNGIRILLPHAWLWEGERSLVDADGSAVVALVRDADINWFKELDDLHVTALSTWAKILSLQDKEGAVTAAGTLCDHIWSHFGPNQLDVAQTRIDVAKWQLSRLNKAVATGEVVADRAIGCADAILTSARLVHEVVHGWLDFDVSYAAATWLQWIGDELKTLGDTLAGDGRALPAVMQEAVDRHRLAAQVVRRPSGRRRIVARGRRKARAEAKAAYDRARGEAAVAPLIHAAYTGAQEAYTRLHRDARWPRVLHDIGAQRFELGASIFAFTEQAQAAKRVLADFRGSYDPGVFEPGALVELRADLVVLGDVLSDVDPDAARAECWRASIDAYEAAIETAAVDPTYSPIQSRFEKGLVALAQTGESGDVLSEFQAAARHEAPDWAGRSALVESLVEKVTSEDAYGLLKTWLRGEAAHAAAASAKPGWADAQAALAVLVAKKHLELARSVPPVPRQAAESLFPVATPIYLDADNDLFPQEEGWHLRHPLFLHYLPAMRNAIKAETGIRAPGVRVRADFLGPGAYVIRLNEVPFAVGLVDNYKRFSPDSDACEALGLVGAYGEGPNRAGGVWLDESDAARAARAGVVVWDHFEHMVLHLEAVVREELATFLDVEEIQTMLAEWRDDGASRDLVDEALNDEEAVVALGFALRRLVGERVPVTDGSRILRVFLESRRAGRRVDETVESLRLSLRDVLPGNEATRRLVGLSFTFEEAVAAFATRPRVRAPDEVEPLLGAVRRWFVDLDGGEGALVVRRPGLRTHVQRLVAREFPMLPVLDGRELAMGRTVEDTIAPGGAAT